MCGSIKGSLATYVLSGIAALALWWQRPTSTDSRWLAMFLLTFSTMQLVDAGIWVALQHHVPQLNRFLSRFVLPMVLLAELWVNYVCAVCLAGRSRSHTWEAILAAFSAGTVVLWYSSCERPTVCMTTTTVTTDTVVADRRLLWCDQTIHCVGRVLFFVLLMWPVLQAFPAGSLRGILLTTLMLTFVHAYPRKDFGSHWCWSSNSMAILVLIDLCISSRYLKL